MNDEFDRIFDDCIDRLKRGQRIDHILQLYPDHAEALAPLLKATSDLQEQASFIPSEEAKAAGKQRLLQARYEMSQQRTAVKVSLIDRLFGQPKIWAPIAAVLLMFVIGLAVVALIDSGNDELEETVAIPGTSTTPSVSTTPTAPTQSTPLGTSTEPTTTPGISPTTTTPDTSVPPTTTPGDIVVADAGFLEIRVTDAPNHDISAVYLTISNIEVHQPQTGEQEAADEGPWETVIGESHTFELLKLRGGIEQVLGSRQLPVGHYSQIRLDVEEVIVTVNGEDRIAKVPSEAVKLVGNFEIEAGQTTALTLDFDAAESVRVLGNGNVNFTPVVHVTVTKGQQLSAPTG